MKKIQTNAAPIRSVPGNGTFYRFELAGDSKAAFSNADLAAATKNLGFKRVAEKKKSGVWGVEGMAPAGFTLGRGKNPTRTSTSTEVRSPTKTSTEAYTADNLTVTVTGGAGDGDTSVAVVPGGRRKNKGTRKK